MGRSRTLVLLAALAACGDEGGSFDFVDGPLEGEHAIAFRVSGSGAHLLEPGQRGSQSLSGIERWGDWDLAPGLGRIAAAVDGAGLQLIDRASGARTTLWSSGGFVRFSPSGDRLVVVAADGLVVLDLDGTIVREHSLRERAWFAVWAPDGSAVTYCLEDPSGHTPGALYLPRKRAASPAQVRSRT